MPVFPINYPTNRRLVPKKITFTKKNQAAEQQSPFSGLTQVHKYQGEWMEMNLTMATLNHADAEELTGFLCSLGGIAGSFKFKLPDHFLITSNQSITIAANGNDFTGGSGIEVGKYGVSNTGRLVKFTSSSSLVPALAPGSTTITYASGSTMRLLTNELNWDSDEMRTNEITFAIKESF